MESRTRDVGRGLGTRLVISIMVWIKQQYLWIIISAAAVCVSCQELTSTLRDRNRACRGEEVTFTCTIRGSADVSTLILAWSSTEYIGQGDPLRFITQDTQGVKRISEIDGNVTATLINNTNIDGVPVLVSKLRIVADQSSTVTCTSEATSGTMSQVFTVSADCGEPISNAKLNYSSTLEGSILTLTCENEMSLNSINEMTLSVTCHSNGSWIPNPAQFTCSSFTTVTVPSGSTGTTDRSDHSLGVIIGSVLGVLMIAAIAIIVAILATWRLIKKGFLHPKRVNRLPNIQLENTYHPYTEQNSPAAGQPDLVQQDTLVYADIGPSSVHKRNKQFITLKPDDMDDRVEYALLNHSLQKPVIATNQGSIADDSLNLDTLLIQVRGAVTPHWYQLGQALEVSKDVLDKCTNYPPEESIVEVLDQWLRNFPGRPTWRDVANALKRICFQQLANDIEMVYETGKLPIAVDDDSQQVLTTTALELLQQEEETTRTLTTFNISGQDQDESAPPLPPKPPAESELPKKMLAPPRPPKYVVK